MLALGLDVALALVLGVLAALVPGVLAQLVQRAVGLVMVVVCAVLWAALMMRAALTTFVESSSAKHLAVIVLVKISTIAAVGLVIAFAFVITAVLVGTALIASAAIA